MSRKSDVHRLGNWLICLALPLLFMSSFAQAQAASRPYIVRVAPEAYLPLPLAGGVATTQPVQGDDEAVTISLPFPVSFFGVNYSQIGVSTNGYAAFAGNSATAYSNQVLPSASTPNGLVAAWWDDNNCPSGGIKTQSLGSAPTRQFIVQWHCNRHSGGGSFETQLWLSEGSSTLRVKYGTITSSSSWSATMGIENLAGNVAYQPSTCGGTCIQSHWLTNQVVTYAQGPDLVVDSVIGDVIAYTGVSTHIEAVASNAGGQDANGFGMRFWVSRDNRLSVDDALVGMGLPSTWNAAPSASVSFALDAPIPLGLAPGQYYLLAEVDPLQAVAEDNETNNVGAYGPFEIGSPEPDLAVESIDVPSVAQIGSAFALDWTARNIGNRVGTDVPYALLLSNNDVITPSDRTIFTGVFTAQPLTTTRVQAQVLLEQDVPPGMYWLGIVIDPDNAVTELNELNNVGVSAGDFTVQGGSLRITTATLPAAEINSRYCVLLEAAGGSGSYSWSLSSGSLPPGLALAEERDGGDPLQPPLLTLICGYPSQAGIFDFGLEAASAGNSTTMALQLVVNRSGAPLEVPQAELREARFLNSYEETLVAMGGKAPYSWRLLEGVLPAGLELDRKGVIHGLPRQDGAFSFRVEVEDAVGAKAGGSYSLRVLPPSRITCASGSLPPGSVGAAIAEQLVAAGGQLPYTWSTRESRRFASEGDPGQSYNDAPPGLKLAADGTVSGAPTAAGRYLWTVEVQGRDGARDECELAFDVRFDQNITVLTLTIPDAFVDVFYRAQLLATGGVGELRWSVGQGQRLPEGLSLSGAGELTGILTTAILDGDDSKAFSFYIQVADETNRINELPLSVVVHRRVPPPEKPRSPPEPTGCKSSMTTADPSLLAMAAALGLAALRRRRA